MKRVYEIIGKVKIEGVIYFGVVFDVVLVMVVEIDFLVVKVFLIWFLNYFVVFSFNVYNEGDIL